MILTTLLSIRIPHRPGGVSTTGTNWAGDSRHLTVHVVGRNSYYSLLYWLTRRIRTSVLSTRVTVSLRIIFTRRIMYNVLSRLRVLRDGTDA